MPGFIEERTSILTGKKLETRLLNLKDHSWFEKNADHEDDWLCAKGTMSPDFLHLEDEKSSLFFEKFLIAGEVVKDDEKILHELSSFYSDLYRTQSIKSCQQIQDFLKGIGSIPHIKQDTSGLVGPITEKEVLTAISCLRPGKPPGSDGLTSEFYKHFAEQVSCILAKVFNTCFENGSLTPSQCLVIIILLFKKGDSMLLGNYRPISLINSDYKILAYILTARLEEHLSDVIAVNQTAYMRGHFIGCNIHSVQDAISYFHKHNLPHLALFLDYKKAFDSVDHSFLFLLLEHMGILLDYIAWIHVMYSDAISVVLHNGWLMSPFFLGRGVQQGCPLSCHLLWT